jgi:antitoxin VapB
MSATSSLSTRHVRLFKNGRNQAVRIPREFELPGQEALMHKDALGRLIIEPVPRKGLVALLASWTPLPKEDAMPEIEDLPPEPVDF